MALTTKKEGMLMEYRVGFEPGCTTHVLCTEEGTGRQIRMKFDGSKDFRAAALMEFWNVYQEKLLTEKAEELCVAPFRCLVDGVWLDALCPPDNEHRGLGLVGGRGRITTIGAPMSNYIISSLLGTFGYTVMFYDGVIRVEEKGER